MPAWTCIPAGTAASSALSASAHLFTTPLSLFLTRAFLLVLRFRPQRGALCVVMLWTIPVSIVARADPTGLQEIARTGATGALPPCSSPSWLQYVGE
ncbi:MAG: hypothetical protein HKN30_05085 [Sulfitobacter sp.]|nr:hypothetical protein [Sulfitobacter sp.]